MKFSPLTIPYISLISPALFERILSLKDQKFNLEISITSNSSVTGLDVKLEYDKTKNLLSLKTNGMSRFYPGEYMSNVEFTQKMSDFLIGKTLDYLVDIPDAEHCIINAINKTRVSFKHKSKPLSLEIVPRHNPESYKAQKDRFWVKSFLTNFKHKHTTIKIFERIFSVKGEKRIIKMLDAAFLERNAILQFTGEDVGDDKIRNIYINRNGGPPSVTYANGTVVSDNKVEIAGVMPQVMQQALSEGSFSKVLDHWIYSDTEIKKSTQFKEKMRINIKETQKEQTLMEAFPDFCKKRIALVEMKEERSRSPLLAAYIKDQIARGTQVAKYLKNH